MRLLRPSPGPVPVHEYGQAINIKPDFPQAYVFREVASGRQTTQPSLAAVIQRSPSQRTNRAKPRPMTPNLPLNSRSISILAANCMLPME